MIPIHFIHRFPDERNLELSSIGCVIKERVARVLLSCLIDHLYAILHALKNLVMADIRNLFNLKLHFTDEGLF